MSSGESDGEGEEVPATSPSSSSESLSPYASNFLVAFEPDRVKAALEQHPRLVEEIQALLFFHRPITTLIILTISNSLLWILAKCRLTLYSTVIFLVIGFLLLKASSSQIPAGIFPGEVPKGPPDAPNRIRPVNEVEPIAIRLAQLVSVIVEAIWRIADDRSSSGLLFYAALSFAGFLLTYSINLFRLTVIAVNLVLILPGIWMNPIVVKFKDRLLMGSSCDEPE
jgi:hypothetical protein